MSETKVETLAKPLTFLAEELEEAWAQSKDKLDAWAAIQTALDKFINEWENARIIRSVCEAPAPVSIVTREAWETFVIGYAGLCCLTKEECRRRQSSDDATFDEWWTEREVDAHVVLTALGPFVVADETCNIVSERVVLELTRAVPSSGEEESTCIVLRCGDTIYIKRRESEERDE